MSKEVKRFEVVLDSWTERDLEYSELRVQESSTGEWVRHDDFMKLKSRINRLQQRLDLLEGRITLEE